MLKDDNARFVQGKMLKRNLMQQVKATGKGSFRLQPSWAVLIRVRLMN